jgi:hypothetical protein
MTRTSARMIDPFSSWTRMVAASMDIARTGMRTGETIAAAFDVLAARGEVIGEAIRSPATADHAELAMLVPEKVAAMSQSGVAVMTQLVAMQVALLTEASHVGAMAMRGRPPTLAEMSELSARGTNYMLGSMERTSLLAAGALAPIHKRVTGNARRLRRNRKPG